MARTLLVVGGMGFIGSNFIHYWHSKYPDDRFVVIDKFGYAGKWENIYSVIDIGDFGNNGGKNRVYRLNLGKPDGHFDKFFYGTSNQQELLDQWFKDSNPTLCVNFAAESHVDNSITGPEAFNTNYTGMLVLLEALKDRNTPLIHISTDEVLEHYPPYRKGDYIQFWRQPESIQEELDEYSPKLRPSSVYSASKAAQEMLCHAYRKTWGMDITIVRLTNNYGPRQHVEKLLPKVITNALKDKPIPVYGAGDQWRDWLYVEDSCSALDLIIEKGARNETYHVSAQQEQQNIEVIKKILKKLDKPETLIYNVEDRKGHDYSYSLDSSKLRALGWKPKVSFDEGLDKTIRWYKR